MTTTLASVLALALALSAPPAGAAAKRMHTYEWGGSAAFAASSPLTSWSSTFADGTGAAGYLVADVVSAPTTSSSSSSSGGPDSEVPRAFVAWGALFSSEERADYAPFPWEGDGVLGLAPAAPHQTSQVLEGSVLPAWFGAPQSASDMDKLFTANGAAQSATNTLKLKDGEGPSFAVALGEDGGTLALPASALPRAAYAAPPQVVPVTDASEGGAWKVGVSQIRALRGGRIVNPNLLHYEGAAIVDTGAAALVLPQDAFGAFQSLTAGGLPDLEIVFANCNVSLIIPASAYAFTDSEGVTQLAVQGGDSFQLGDPFFRSAVVEFFMDPDTGNSAHHLRIAPQSNTLRRMRREEDASSSSSSSNPVHDHLLRQRQSVNNINQDNDSAALLLPVARRVVDPVRDDNNDGHEGQVEGGVRRRAASGEAVPVTSNAQVRYLVDIQVGAPNAQTLSLLLDTGSEMMMAFTAAPPLDAGLIVLIVCLCVGCTLAVGTAAFCVIQKRRKLARAEEVLGRVQ